MIIDTTSHLSRYSGLAASIDKAIAYISKTNLASLAAGRVEIAGDEVFALVQSYETRPRESFVFESHRKYIDLQIVVSGYESMLWAPVESLAIETPYDESKDAALYHRGPNVELAVGPGMFCIFFPEDGHQPGCRTGTAPQTVGKIVVKCCV